MDGTETELTWEDPDAANFQVFAIRDKAHSQDAYFKLTASAGGMILGDIDLNNGITSSYFTDVYNNSKWNFAVRLTPRGYPQSISSGALDDTYNVEFYGVNYIADRKINEFEVTKAITATNVEAFLTSSKRAYVGAHATNFTGSTLQYSDVKVTSLRYWFDYLNNATIQYHAIDPGNFGQTNPYRDTYLLQSDLASTQIPKMESLALHWDFDAVTGSDSSGQFTVQDASSGSLYTTGSYGWLGKILKYQHTGRGDSFPASSTGSVDTQYLYAGRQQLPEVVYGDDNVRVLSQAETEVFTRETRPTKTYYAFEKSMNQIISNEMLNYFGSIAEFNNLIGAPVNRYRPEYKGLKYLRQFFFDRVRNEPDLDKFVDYYKWLDSTLEAMLMQLVPASAQVSDGIDNVVESHILERSKYWSKLPTLEFNVPTPITGALGICRLLYSWPRNHRPLSGLESDNCEYWKKRAERDTDPLNKLPGDNLPADAGFASATIVTHADIASYDFIRIVSTDGTSRDYEARTTNDLANNLFKANGTAQETATNLEDCIKHANGHAGKITVSRPDTETLVLTQATAGAAGNTTITIGTSGGGSSWLNATVPSGFTGGTETAGQVSTAVTDGRKLILSASTQVLERCWTTPYRYTVEKIRNVHGGTNYSENKRPHFYRGMNAPHGPKDTFYVPENVLVTFEADVQPSASCDDEIIPNLKKKYAFGTHTGRGSMISSSFDRVKGEIAMPFNLINASLGIGGYNNWVQDEFLSNAQLVNLHSDCYGDQNEIPMQGPFTEKYVGGHQARHVRLNGGAIWNLATARGSLKFISGTPSNYNGESFTLESTNGLIVIYKLDSTTAANTYAPPAGGTTKIGISGAGDAAAISALVVSAINTAPNPHADYITAVYSAPLVELTQDIGGKQGNTPITTTDSTDITVSSFDGGTDGIIAGDRGRPHGDLDGPYSRPEAYRLLLGRWWNPAGALGITGPDYGGPYPDQTRYRAWWFREETAKRPVNIRNILQTTASVDTVLSGVLQHGPIGNYEKTYQIVQTSGRSTNNFWFNDNGATLPARYTTNNPKTTNVHTLVGVRHTADLGWNRGNGFLAGPNAQGADEQVKNLGRLSSRYYPLAVASPDTNKVTVFTLPSRTKQDAVFVERFSAPGGPEINSLGFLDIMAAEKSVYNALPYRNLMVRGSGSGEPASILASGNPKERSATIAVNDQTGHRRGLRTLLALHAGPFGSDAFYGEIKAVREADDNLSASFHKVNRNARWRILADQNSDHDSQFQYNTGAAYDNWHIQHSIPQNDFQYSWLSASFLSGNTPMGYAPPSGMISASNGLTTAITFLSSSSPDYSGAAHVIVDGGPAAALGVPVDFVGLNTLIYDPMGGTRHEDPIAEFGPFNILSSSEPVVGQDYQDLLYYRNAGFAPTAPIPHNGPVPMLGYMNDTIWGFLATSSFNALMLHRNGPYGWCSWKQVRGGAHPLARAMRAHNTYGVIEPETERRNTMGQYSGYAWSENSSIQLMYGSSGSYKKTRDREVTEFYEPAVVKHQPMVFNVAMNVQGAQVADTTCESAPSSPLSPLAHAVIKTTFANQKDLFSNSKLNNKLQFTNRKSGFGSCTTTSADKITKALKSRALDADILNIKYSESVFPKKINIGRNYVRTRTTFKEDFWRDSRIDRNEQLSVTQPNIDPDGANTTPYNQSRWPLDGRMVGSSPTHGGVFKTDNPGIKTAYDVYIAAKGGPGAGSLTSPFGEGAAGNEGRLQNSVTFIHTGFTDTSGEECGGVAADSSGGRVNPWYITASATYARRHTNITGSSVIARSSFLFPDRDVANQAVVPFAGDAPWDAGVQSGKNPFYDSYADYVMDMSIQGKDYSIIPEFRISERMEPYILEGVDPFDDSAFLSLTGSKLATTNSDQTDFFQTYSHSDFMKYFNVVQNDMSTQLNAVANEITVTAKGLCKLLPYDGFYPASRTLQLADLFSSSLEPNVFLTGTANNLSYDPRESYWRAFLTPFFAPGLMFNAIKSGIAVDFPIFTGSVPATGTTDNHNFYITNDLVDYRVPFEALVDPSIISDITIYDMESHPSGAFSGTFFGDFGPEAGVRSKWNGIADKRYELAMHNFLAETPEFFLENGTFTSFFSAPRSQWNSPDRLKKYLMRIKVRKSYSLSNSITSLDTSMDQPRPQITTGSETICMYSRPSAFGPPSAGVITDNETYWGRGGGSRAGYNAPFTPCYYDGDAWLTLEYNPILHEDTEMPTLDILLSRLTASHLRYTGWKDDEASANAGLQNGLNDNININANQVTSSINAFGTTKGLADLLRYSGYSGDDEDQWVIQTKFETPILNFIDSVGTGLTSMEDNFAATPCSGGLRSRAIGMWHQYGRLPLGSEGVFLDISDVPSKYFEGYHDFILGQDGTGSLADLVGFAKQSQRLGRTATSKTIREAIVAVPFIEKNNERHFFTLPKDQIEAAAAAAEGSEVQGVRQSVKQMVDAMPKYVFPPSFDFIKYPHKVTPISMYIFEFTHTLNQQDLVDIWQNLPPRIGRAFDSDSTLSRENVIQTKTITHILQSDEICCNIDPLLQWMVFKVKQKAATNYWKKTVENNPNILQSALARTMPTPPPIATIRSSGMRSMTAPTPSFVSPFKPMPKVVKPATRFTAIDMPRIVAEGAGAGAVLKTGDFRRSYNWPYDFFSLVELVKVDVETTFTSPEARAQGTTVNEQLLDLTKAKLVGATGGQLMQQTTQVGQRLLSPGVGKVVSSKTGFDKVIRTRRKGSKGKEK